MIEKDREANPTPVEPDLAYLRQSHPGSPVELVISLDGKNPHMVYTLRASILVGIMRDSAIFVARSIAPSSWERMWARKFDYPERI